MGHILYVNEDSNPSIDSQPEDSVKSVSSLTICRQCNHSESFHCFSIHATNVKKHSTESSIGNDT